MPPETQSPVECISSPWVMGVLAAVVALASALAVCVVPALAAQLSASGSPMTVLGAVLLGLDVFVLGHGGSLVLADGAVEGPLRLIPLGLTGVLLLLSASAMRRMGRALSLVAEEGALRPGALRDGGATLISFIGTYSIGGGVLAALARTPRVHAVSSTAVVACALVALVGGGAGLLWSLRRRAAPGVPAVRILDLLPAPFDVAARGAAISLLGLLAGAMLTVVGAVVIGFSRVAALTDSLAPGPVGGTVLLLLQLALMPTIAVWALAALLGGHFAVGVGTSVSLGASQTGLLPALPLLAALPEPGRAPWYAYLLLALPVAALGLGAVRVVRDVAGADLRTRATAWGSYAGAVLVGVVALLLLASGSIGDARLRDLGPDVASTLLPLLGMVLGTLGAAILVLDSPALERGREAVAGLRARVEQEEAREHAAGEASGQAAGARPAAGDADQVAAADGSGEAAVTAGQGASEEDGPEDADEVRGPAGS